jgi:hypothetical protein
MGQACYPAPDPNERERKEAERIAAADRLRAERIERFMAAALTGLAGESFPNRTALSHDEDIAVMACNLAEAAVNELERRLKGEG